MQGKACQEYLDCLHTLRDVLNHNAIPRFEDLDEYLCAATGWTIEVVPGHIPVEDFFLLLSQRKFPSSTWLRSMSQLDYLEEPDMFHDIYGHIPLLMDARYAAFMEMIGKLGVQWAGSSMAISALRSLYWFTIEFGLTQGTKKRSIYGAGILSSYGESLQVVGNGVECRPFDIDGILHTNFRTDTLQELYYTANGLDQVYASLSDTEAHLAARHLQARTT